MVTVVIAGPARRDGRQVVQANGEVITVYLHGDEHFSWETDAEGNWIEMQSDGNYAIVPKLSNCEIQCRRKASPTYSAHTMAQAALPQRGVIILANYTDVSITTDINSIRNAMAQEGYTNPSVGAVGSAHDYFKASSNGKYAPEFDVWGPYTVSKKASGYCGSNGRNSDGYILINEVCSLAYNDGHSFAAYDQNGDYEVDFVYVIYAGYDQAQGAKNVLWAHAHNMAAAGVAKANRTYGGYSINKFACSSELAGNSGTVQNGIGSFCHEFSHILGMPDYYVTDGESNPNYDLTCGEWDLMDYGCYNNNGWAPPLYSAYDRYFMGWETPIVMNMAANDTVPITGTGEGSTRVITATGQKPLYTYTQDAWYIENRQQTGWDAYLPGHGLLVTKVKYNSSRWAGNTVNNSTPMLYDIQEAGGKLTFFGDPSDTYPGTMNITTYTPTGSYTLSEINELSDGRVAYKFMGGVTPTGMENGEWKMENGKLKIENGIIVIERQGCKYNLLGNRLCR